ncbi:transcription factor NIGT1-like isoform X2 [Zingiber officinale]|uniref:transcription factor NIGT1-like isoform X2 n=1 Tax=Zingiber officinale TaxID=94328 RepID=UPI001C4DA948|nr:transcription factor NIGT1-like isoform X2 [Zingiber officinale]
MVNQDMDYVRALEEERRKIQVFQRELPLCMKLVTRAIERLRQQMDDRPVLEEFIPLKLSSSSSSSPEDRLRDSQMSTPAAAATRFSEKLDWLKSVQIWNQSAETEAAPIAVSGNGGDAFHPFATENKIAAPAGSNASKGDACGGEDKKEGQLQGHRKTRRSWSPELHRRFLRALEQLGGSHVATPKQIKELMKVDGLTNDEVKSHLQKYRLYNRRRSPEDKRTENIRHVQQFVLISGMCVQPQESTAAPPPAVCTSGAALASDLRFKQQKQNKTQSRGNDDDGASNSSSSQTTTVSPP